MKRTIPTLAVVGFLGFQSWGLARGFIDRVDGFPWAMFSSMPQWQFYLEAAAITDDGEVLVPLDQAFPYHARQTDFAAFDWAPIRSNPQVQERLAHWLGHWMRKRGIPATHVSLRWRIHNLGNGEISRRHIVEVDLRVPPIR